MQSSETGVGLAAVFGGNAQEPLPEPSLYPHHSQPSLSGRKDANAIILLDADFCATNHEEEKEIVDGIWRSLQRKIAVSLQKVLPTAYTKGSLTSF